MKYHSIIMDSLDKYAGLGFESFEFDGVQWFRGVFQNYLICLNTISFYA